MQAELLCNTNSCSKQYKTTPTTIWIGNTQQLSQFASKQALLQYSSFVSEERKV
jgi:hypothetical protein